VPGVRVLHLRYAGGVGCCYEMKGLSRIVPGPWPGPGPGLVRGIRDALSGEPGDPGVHLTLLPLLEGEDDDGLGARTRLDLRIARSCSRTSLFGLT